MEVCMRLAIIGAVVLTFAFSLAPAVTFAAATSGRGSDAVLVAAAPSAATVLKVDLPKVDVDVDVHKGGRAWYKNPIVIGMGALVVVLLIVLASRGGGGTTIIDRRS
jgi:hypothetical protein